MRWRSSCRRNPTLLIVFNKPYGVLCQFRDDSGRPTLADYIDRPGVYPAGRLDRDSEGLLVLTDDGRLQHRITDPRHRWGKRYWVQVEGIPRAAQLQRLRRGIELGDGRTRPAEAEVLSGAPPGLWRRDPPIDQRRHPRTAWLQLMLFEGRNRQVRRMTAAVGLPTLRLIRAAIGPWSLEGLAPGHWRSVPVPPDAAFSRPRRFD